MIWEHGDDSHDSGREGFKELQIDPGVRRIFKYAKKIQQELDGIDPSDTLSVVAAIGRLNAEWLEDGGNFKEVYVGGKLRIAEDGREIHPAVRSFLEGLDEGTDENGPYHVARGVALKTGFFTLYGDARHASPAKSPALTVSLPIDGPDEAGAMYNDDPLYIFPDDVEQLHFDPAPFEAVEELVDAYFPEAHRRIKDILTDDVVDGPDIELVEALQRLEIPIDEARHDGRAFDSLLGNFIFGKANFDDTEYSLSVSGTLSVVEFESPTDLTEKRVRNCRLQGQICGVSLGKAVNENGFEVYRPALIVAVAENESHGGYCAYVVPCENIQRFRNTRGTVTQMGHVSLAAFESPSQLADFFAPTNPLTSVHDSFRDAERREQDAILGPYEEGLRGIDIPPPMTPEQADQALSELDKTFDDTPNLVGYDAERQRYVVDLTPDMREVVGEFYKRVEEARNAGEDVVGDEALDRIARKAASALGLADSVQDGDVITVGGPISPSGRANMPQTFVFRGFSGRSRVVDVAIDDPDPRAYLSIEVSLVPEVEETSEQRKKLLIPLMPGRIPDITVLERERDDTERPER